VKARKAGGYPFVMTTDDKFYSGVIYYNTASSISCLSAVLTGYINKVYAIHNLYLVHLLF
jgi:hypothetical protein